MNCANLRITIIEPVTSGKFGTHKFFLLFMDSF